LQSFVHHCPDRSQRVIRRYPLFKGSVTEQLVLLLVCSAHIW
jgi:hypothetical protein